MSEQKKIISISTARKKVIGPITVDGVEHDVHQLTFGVNQKLQAVTTLGAFLEVVRLVCPTLPQETIDAMSLEDATVIMRYAAAGIDAVAEMFPNAVSPETQT